MVQKKSIPVQLKKLSRSGVLKHGIMALGVAALLIAGTPAAEADQPRIGAKKVIRSDNGGRVSKYAVDVYQAKHQNTQVEIRGKCLSACTLYLSMPKNQICITPGASFGFHKAYGSTRRLNNWGNQYMMTNYPDWVVSWINAKGGLTNSLMRMNYNYASRYLPACFKGKTKQRMVRNENPRDSHGNKSGVARSRYTTGLSVVSSKNRINYNPMEQR